MTTPTDEAVEREKAVVQYDGVVSKPRAEPNAFKRQCFRDGWDAAIAAMQPSVADDKSPDWEGFGRAMVDGWPTNDIDGADLFELAAQYRLIAEVAGGYDPETHIDADCICPERGDPWYEYNFRAISKETDNA